MIPLVGFLPPDDPRVRGTVAAIEKRLLRGRVRARATTRRRASDGLPPGEGAFLACSFWLADNYALLGERDKAREMFDRLAGALQRRGPARRGVRPGGEAAVGNFPQAFSHVGLVNTALNLSRPAEGPAEQRKNK